MADYFLKLDGIPGESTAEGHKDEIEIESFSWGASSSSTAYGGGGGGAGKVSVHDISMTKVVDRASPKLFLYCARGDVIRTATLTLRSSGENPVEFYVLTLTDCLVSTYASTGSAGADALPVDQFTLNFATIRYEYRQQSRDGTTGAIEVATFDRRTGRAT